MWGAAVRKDRKWGDLEMPGLRGLETTQRSLSLTAKQPPPE